MGGFPTSVEQITPAWLAEVIGSPVESADIEQIGAGIGVMSALYRVQLTGSGCPKTVVVKLPALAEESVFTSTVLRMYLREGAFFTELAEPGARSGPGVPPLHRRPRGEPVRPGDGGPRAPPSGRPGEGHADPRCGAGRRRPGRLARHLVGQGAGARRAGRDREPRRSDLQGRAADGVRRGVGEARQGAHDPCGHPGGRPAVDRRHARTARRSRHRADHDGPRRLAGRQPALRARRLGRRPRLPAHRHRPWHLRPGLLHHPEPRPGRCRRARAGPLRPLGRSAVEAAGVPAADNATAWEDYRKAALFCLVYPVVAWRGMDAGDPRQVDLALTMLDRFDRAVAELDLAELL